jgi:hypothetical protein
MQNLIEKPDLLILLAGKASSELFFADQASSPMLAMVNGRPALSWVLEQATEDFDKIVAVAREDDTDLVTFLEKWASKRQGRMILTISDSGSIASSILVGLEGLKDKNAGVRVLFGDTLLLSDVEFKGDTVVSANISGEAAPWCLVNFDDESRVPNFNKLDEGVLGPNDLVAVGQFDFADKNLLSAACEAAIGRNGASLADLLTIYGKTSLLNVEIVDTCQWLDFGHQSGFLEAKRRLIESRSFNRLVVDATLPIITKSSHKVEKLEKEFYWYENMPKNLKSLTPQVIDFQSSGSTGELVLEYLGYSTVAEKYVYGQFSDHYWFEVLDRIFRVLELFRSHTAQKTSIAGAMEQMLVSKTLERIGVITDPAVISVLDSPTLKINDVQLQGWASLAKDASSRGREVAKHSLSTLIHGDLCFANILFDASSGCLKLIDPRGDFGSPEPSIFGDLRYDLAKLRHSFIGAYDHVIEGQYSLQRSGASSYEFKLENPISKRRELWFDDRVRQMGFDADEIKLIEGLLFLSMIPLHDGRPDRQLAFALIGTGRLNEILP